MPTDEGPTAASQTAPAPRPAPGTGPPRADGVNWVRRIVVALALVAAVVLLGFLASATVPRWWAQRVGNQVDGSITVGVLAGLFYGFVFTLLPVAVLAAVLRFRRTWRAIIVGLVAAVLLAGPNLMTLGIVLGRGNAAHAGDRILDVEAPAFRGASLAGVILAVAFAVYVAYLSVSRRRARSAERRAQEELAARRRAAPRPDRPAPPEA